jgi:polyisoprenoid-binding protein YceI
MKNLLFIAALLFSSANFAQTISKAESKINFEVGSLWVRTVVGTIGGFEGTVKFDPNNLSATKMDVTAQVATIKTDTEKRDDHLRTADFFDVAKYPTMRFQSTKVEKLAKGGYKLTGKLTIKDVTREVSFPFTIEPAAKDGQILKGELSIKRMDYNVGVDQSFFSVSNEIKVKIECVVR